MGVAMAVDHRGRRRRRLRRHPQRARSARSSRGAGLAARPAADRGRRARLPAAADHLRRAGAGDRLHARRRRLPRRATCSTEHGAATILFVCFVGPALRADAGVGGGRRAGRQEARLRRRRRWCSPPARCSRCSARSAPAGVVFAAVGAGRRRATPAARSSRWRCCPTRRRSTRGRTGANRAGVYTGVWTAGETLGLALGPGRLRAGARAGRLRVVDRRRRRPARLGADRDHARLLGAARPSWSWLSLWWLRAVHARRRARSRDHGGGPA